MPLIIDDLLHNYILIAGVSGWMIAQVLKAIIYAMINKEFSVERLFGDGGMPSAHSATVVSMATATAFNFGLGSFQFALAGMLAIIVMHDAMGVRREVGKHASAINELMDEFGKRFQEQTLDEFWSETNLKKFVGHTPLQVGAGAILGFVVGVFIH